MSYKLMILLIITCVVFTIIIFYNIFKRRITLQFSLMWFTYILLMVLALISPPFDVFLADILGFEVVSNMVMFFGILALYLISFKLSKEISLLKEKNNLLTQELALLKNKKDDNK